MMYVYGHVPAMVCRSEDNIQEMVLFVFSGNVFQGSNLGS